MAEFIRVLKNVDGEKKGCPVLLNPDNVAYFEHTHVPGSKTDHAKVVLANGQIIRVEENLDEIELLLEASFVAHEEGD